MSRQPRQNLTLADRMAEAGIEPFWVDQVRTLQRGYGSLRTTCRLLYEDNAVLRARLRSDAESTPTPPGHAPAAPQSGPIGADQSRTEGA